MTAAMTLVTICVPMLGKGHQGRLLAEDVASDLRKLGNPALPAVRKKLDDDKLIHFMSICTIAPTEQGEAAMLILEVTGDGTEDDVIAAIDSGIGDLVFPILARACGFKRRDELRMDLKKHAKLLSTRSILGRKITGLGFMGIEDFSVKEILGHAEIARIARARLHEIEDDRRNDPRGQRPRPLEIIAEVDDAITDSAHRRMIEEAAKAPTPGYVDRPDSSWIRAAIRKLRRGDQPSEIARIFALIKTLPVVIWVIVLLIYVGWAAYFLSPQFWFADRETIRILLAIAVVPTLITSAIFFIGVLALLRHKEKTNTPNDDDPDPDLIAALLSTENPPDREGKGQWVQNHMISVGELHGRWFRRFITLPFALRLIMRKLLSGGSRKGFLTDMGVVHFARWVVPPGSNKLIFFSNYDGSWESYFEDFIIKVADGVTAIWGNLAGFPKTRYLINEGAVDGDRFKRFSRRSMIPTPFWYAAYPEISAEQVRKNGLFVHGLAKIRTASEAEAWLEMFASMPRPEFATEKSEIQNIAFGGNQHLSRSRIYALRFKEELICPEGEAGPLHMTLAVELWQKWIAAMLPGITFGEIKRDDFAFYLGLSMSGLEKLGMRAAFDDGTRKMGGNPKTLEGLPPAFVQGMHHPSRQRVLRDPPSADWNWGGENSTVDAVMLVYWPGPERDQSDGKSFAESFFENNIIAHLGKSAIEVVDRIDTMVEFYKPSACPSVSEPMAVEPFGFVDGVSQPKVRNLTATSASASSIHQVETGEFILGYRDNLGYLPPTPTVMAKDDDRNCLPSLPPQLPLRWPGFGERPRLKPDHRDFGRNGSFLVIRELAQDVEGFDKYVEKVAEDYAPQANTANAGHGGPASKQGNKDWVASRMVGRWQNGSSLARYPFSPGPSCTRQQLDKDNEFLFGEDDPQGIHCPLGAHVRRANPRDSQNPRSPNQLDVSNRHRLLRRGRTFERNEGGKTQRGTMFMCLNADIERQFEFIQQTWINGEAFHGLTGERDPIAASKGADFDYSIPSEMLAGRFRDMRSFVTMQGGGYFFLPSYRAFEFLTAKAVPEEKLVSVFEPFT